MSAPFAPRDVVVCMDHSLFSCDLYDHFGGNAPPLGAVRRVVWVGPASAIPHGDLCQCAVLITNAGEDALAIRFRRIDDEVTEDFRAQLKSLSKPKERTKA